MNVVVVGGGFCGSLVAKRLQGKQDIDVTLIDGKPYFEYYPSLARVLFDPSQLRGITVPFSRFLSQATVITEDVVEVTAELVRTATRSISYDILVLATGIEYPIFLKDTTNIATIRSGADLAALSPAVANATRVLIIGGGLIGTELAAEFATRTPDKKTTIIHSQPRLLERMPPHLSRYAHTFLTDRNVTVITGEKVVDHVQGTFVTDRGRRLAADIAFWCAGIKANPYFMASLSPSIFSTQRTLRVNRHLQLEGYPTIFVGGDVASIDEEKTAAHAERHSSLIASNILRMQRNRALHSYHSRQLPMDVSLGAWDGILSLPPLFLVGFLPGITKHLVEAATLARLR